MREVPLYTSTKWGLAEPSLKICICSQDCLVSVRQVKRINLLHHNLLEEKRAPPPAQVAPFAFFVGGGEQTVHERESKQASERESARESEKERERESGRENEQVREKQARVTACVGCTRRAFPPEASHLPSTLGDVSSNERALACEPLPPESGVLGRSGT